MTAPSKSASHTLMGLAVRLTLTLTGLSGAALYASPLLRRGAIVYSIAAKIILDYRLMRFCSNSLGLNVSWGGVHARNASLLFWTITKLEGLWVKAGQYMSSRADVMPDEYLRVLVKCQARLPAPDVGGAGGSPACCAPAP